MKQDDDQLAAFGKFMRAQRRLAQVSLRNLARMSGVSDSYLSQIERGNYRPSPQVVKALAQAFGIEPKQLYTMLGFIDEDDATAPPSVEQAIQLDPKDAKAYYYRGVARGKKRSLQEALADFETYSRLAPSDPDGPKFVKLIRKELSAR